MHKELPNPEDPNDLTPPEKPVQPVHLSTREQKPGKTAANGATKTDDTSGQADKTLSSLSNEPTDSVDRPTPDEGSLSKACPTEKPIDKGNWTGGQVGQAPPDQRKERSVKNGEISPITGKVMSDDLCEHETDPKDC